MKTKGLLTSIMAPEASVRVGEMSSKSRLQINSKKKKKNSQYFLGNQTKAQKREREREREDELQAELAGRLIEFEIQIQIQLGGQLLILNLTAAIHLI